ncbi:hypothetical protein VIGAN_10004100 [Vigna angularis var. angularis]|uniref:Uncharacterized protein n=1 Tax=Vigna angularis var. angularis TaxID=157739 RepID=A0A0S3T0Y0_PHAAN|nr:hypothetical protein VIGAN_10004100 [Vigna angularis var. angularis]
MECLLGFASSVSRDLVCGALNQLRYPCCFNNFVKRLEQKESDLIITKDSVQKFVVHGKKQTRRPSEIVDKWLEDAINDVHNVNHLLEEARTKKICCFGYCSNWIWRYHVGKKLANKTIDLEKFIEKGRKYVPFDRIATLPSNTLDIFLEKCMNFESRQSAYEQLLDAVKNNDVSMIGLYGMGGCGKTTLAMEIRKFIEAEHLFDKVLFVPISSTWEVRRIQEKIASSIQFEFPEMEEMERAQRLYLRLTQEKNIFIILDDVWEKLDFGRIGIPSSEYHKGCKILITSRSEAVCTLMDCQRKIYLPILTDEEAWTLFQNKAFISEDTPDTLKDLGRLISNECKGLPVAIAAVACSLKGKAETIWSVALTKLRHSKPINIERGLTDPYKCLQLSYENLDVKEAKSLFLLCSVFPEDFEIQVELLTICAIGLGIVGEAHSYEEARNEVIAAKIKLVSCCLLLDTDDECVKMHDIVRDVAHIIAKNENKMIKCEEEKDVTVEQNSLRYLWCVKFPNDLDCSNLEFLYLETKMKEFDEIFKRMGTLKVLILVNDEDGKTRLSTVSFKTLTNLRYLFVYNYELRDFSFLGGMTNLQSLSLFDCLLPSFPELQSDVAITLPTLKLLELNKCDIKVKNFEVIKRIPLLEELYIIDIKGEWDANSEDNIEFFKTFTVPETLQRYGIVLGSHKFDHFNYGDIYIHGRTLLLNHFDISNEVIEDLAKKAKDLFVANIHGGVKNIIPDIFQIEGGGLDELNKLEILDSEELECLLDTSSHSSEVVTLFSKLHTLGIENMKNLRVIWHCFLPTNGPFENLEKLDLSDCPRLTFLFTYVVARNLVQLKILKISRCDGLKHILAYDEKTEKSQDEFNTGHPIQIFQNLLDVKISSCRELKHIFSTNIVGGLTQLKVLEIEECDMLDQIIGDIVPLTDQDRKEELDEIIEEGTLSSLASLKITCCGKLGSIFTASIAKTLTSLEELFIEDCKSLKDIVTHERVNKNQEESIVEDEHDCQSDISIFQSLKKLHISKCDLLEGIFPVSFVEELNDITNKQAADLNDFSSLNNTQIELPALQVLELDHIQNRTIVGSYQVICPSLRKLSLDIGRYVGFFNINCSTDVSEATKRDSIAIKISNSDFVPPIESVQYLSKQPHGLNLIMIHNIREIELKGFDKARYLFKLSIASSLMLEILRIKECGGLEYIIDTGDEYGKENMKAIFPNLKELSVYDCFQLKYMIGQYHVANKDYKEIHIQFSALEILSLHDLPNFVGICSTNNLIVTWPSLKNFQCYRCFYPFYGSVSCLTIPTNSKEPIITSTKDPKGIQNNLPTLQTLNITYSEAERIFCLNGQQVNLRLENLELNNLPQMTYIWVAYDNSITLRYLTKLKVMDCQKLEVIFPKSVVRCLPGLKHVTIIECMELKQIMEEDDSNLLPIDGGSEIEMIGYDKEASKNYFTFPNLEKLKIIECAKLEIVFPKSVLRCFPKLNALVIRKCKELKQIIEEDESNLLSIGGSELDEIIGCDKEASKNYFAFPNLEKLEIIECAKMEVVFPKSVLRCLPKLKLLKIRKCKELRQIIEKDVEGKNLSNLVSLQPCFPKLEALHVDDCHKLKRLFSGSASNDLPNLHLLAINGTYELEELVGCKQGKTKVELPRLKLLILMHLLNFRQEIELHNLKNCIIYKCPKLSLTSTTTLEKLCEDFPYEDFNTELDSWQFERIVRFIYEDSTINGSSEFTSSQEIGDIGNESIKEGPLVEGAKTKSSSTGVEDIGIGGGVATRIESGGEDILALDSKVVEQDDKMNEGKAGIVASQGIQVEEGLNLLHKQDGIDFVPNNNIDIYSDIRTKLGAYKHFVDLDVAQISLLVEAITAYPHIWNASKKFSERFQSWRLKILADMLSFLQKESGDSIIPQREKEFHKLCEEAIEIGFESSWVEQMRQRIVVSDPKLGEDIARRRIDENSKSLLHRCSSGDMVRDSQAVEEGDGPKISLEEGSDLVDKEGEIGVVYNDDIVAPRHEEPEEEFVAEVFTSEIPRITASLTNLQTIEKPTPSHLYIPIRETPSNVLVDTQQTSEPCLMKQKKPVGEIPKSEIKSSQIEVRIAKESEGHPKIIQDFGANDITSLFAPIVVGKEGEDKLVGKTLAELEKYLKMSLKDIVSSETNSLRLLSALNFLSNLPFKDVKVSDGLKHIIDTMHRHLPSILFSFKQGFATTDKLAELEARADEVTIKKKFYDEVQRKEVVLKQQIIRLKEEIRVCEVALSSLEEEKNKCIAETVEYKTELENARKDESQMLEVAHKWSVLCSEYELNRMAATNRS